MVEKYTSHESDVANANTVREVFVDAMLREGVITEEIAAEMSRYVIICERPSVLGEFIASCFENDNVRYYAVKTMETLPEKKVEDATFLASQQELHDEIARLKRLLDEKPIPQTVVCHQGSNEGGDTNVGA